jgi:hypothetical protein
MESCVDIVFPGVGWVSLTGVGAMKVRTVAAGGTSATIREPLMPFEARNTTKRFTTTVRLAGRKKKYKLIMEKQNRQLLHKDSSSSITGDRAHTNVIASGTHHDHEDIERDTNIDNEDYDDVPANGSSSPPSSSQQSSL